MPSTTSGAFAPVASQCGATGARPGMLAIGHGEPVVLLHGSMSSKAQWNTLAQQLATQFQAIAIDLQGYGDNSAATARKTFSVDEEIDLLVTQLDDVVGNRAAHLVGHSYGGLVALRLAQRFPARIMVDNVNEPGSLAQVATVIAEHDGNIDNISMSRRSPDFTELTIDLEVYDLKHLSAIIAQLRAKAVVARVERVNG